MTTRIVALVDCNLCKEPISNPETDQVRKSIMVDGRTYEYDLHQWCQDHELATAFQAFLDRGDLNPTAEQPSSKGSGRGRRLPEVVVVEVLGAREVANGILRVDCPVDSCFYERRAPKDKGLRALRYPLSAHLRGVHNMSMAEACDMVRARPGFRSASAVK